MYPLDNDYFVMDTLISKVFVYKIYLLKKQKPFFRIRREKTFALNGDIYDKDACFFNR